MSHNVKKGDYVEFTSEWHQHYPPMNVGLIKYGVALEDSESPHTARVRTVEGDVTALYIHAYGWSGWIPPEIEKVLRDNPQLCGPGVPEE